MSQTISIGVVGPRYWSFMASRMADCLETVVQQGWLQQGSFPRNVLADALRFFDLVRQELTGITGTSRSSEQIALRNPEATFRAYELAQRAMNTLTSQGSHQQEISADRSDALAGYAERACELLKLIDNSQVPTRLESEQVDTAKALIRFFRQLNANGEAEAYKERVAFGSTPRLPMPSR
jgi:hypothetical protein